MIEYTSGDILQCEADALVNTVNCVGVMGRGIALQFKNGYPENFKAYEAACKHEAVQPGRMFVFDTGQLTLPRFIINFPTKRHWRGKSRMEDIEAGLTDLVHVIRAKGIHSIAIPPLGAGLGGLDWREVRPRIARALAELAGVRVLVFEPKGAPANDKMAHAREVPKMTVGRAALVELMQRYLGGLLDPFVTLLEIHKLMYFMQEAGEPLRLQYVKHHYGPYAENLRHVLQAVEGHFITGYADGGDAPDKPLTLVPGAVNDAKVYLAQHEISRARFERVTKLVEGFESSYGLELLASVHWVMSREGATRHESVERQVHGWNARKRQFTPRQLAIAEERLRSQGWLSPEVASAH
ncbi:Appr-1-p processing protein [Verminephrobacter aporrectodeae subsp. tuberculatae]|uniref:type II toxin-antitoxin system antitoxin DNA ADP-ribosyl glycohydrolase DarG n=1 Tax=Verminephrobacter aporrectodeae TaxID=1110389 RepID=UPI002238A80D|nr:macro domain-containing protein [Verminephrobacter aporrectodeae]MCW5219692.1 Appr-1-p processing protein [Verminephrobacter aporrectodeae subsp. tuberculatae]MCW5287610.1 Appr-1-p processing protein [Verminephrobacter aporrectodeae subsp. tuberculatae]